VTEADEGPPEEEEEDHVAGVAAAAVVDLEGEGEGEGSRVTASVGKLDGGFISKFHANQWNGESESARYGRLSFDSRRSTEAHTLDLYAVTSIVRDEFRAVFHEKGC